MYNDRNVNYNNDRNMNYNYNRNMNSNNDGLNISADSTNVDSKNYPHTKAILIQHAQYRYIPFGSVQWYQSGGNQQGQTPGQQLVPIVPAPAAPAPTAPVPAPATPAPTAPAPATPAPKPAAPAPTAPAPAAPAPKPAAPAPKPAAPAPTTGDVNQYVQQVIDLTNAQRSKNGLQL